MSVLAQKAAREAIKAALKKARREKWKKRLLAARKYLGPMITGHLVKRVQTWWQNRKGKAAPTPPAPTATAPTGAGTTSPPTTTTPSGRPRLPWPIYILIGTTLMGLAMVVYAIYPTNGVNMNMPLALLAGALTLAVMLLAYLAYLNKNGPIRWTVWRRAGATTPAQPTPAAGAPPQATAVAVATPPTNWLGAAARIVVGLVLLAVIVLGGWKLMSWATAPTATTAAASTIQEKEVIVGKEWSEKVRVPLGYHVAWESVEDVAYELKSQTGKTYLFPSPIGDEGGPIRIPGRLSSMQFRVVDKEKGSATLRLRFSPMSSR